MSTESPHPHRTPDGLTRAGYCSRGTARGAMRPRGGPGHPRMTRGRQRPTFYSLLRCPYAQARYGSFLCSHRCSGSFSCTRSRAGRHLRDLSGAGSAPTGSRCDDARSEAAEDVGRRQAGNQPPDEEILGSAQEGTAELAEDLVLAPAGVVGEVENVLPRGGQVGADGKVFGVLEEALEPHSSALRSSNVSYCIISDNCTSSCPPGRSGGRRRTRSSTPIPSGSCVQLPLLRLRTADGVPPSARA